MSEEPQVLDVNETQKTHYCVPLWLRDEQVRANTVRVKERIAPRFELNDEPVAVVCYGPSLNDTWEEVRKFKYVFSCSGSHKFLLERGIVPTWHVEVDPRPHKVALIGPPHKDVEYLIASCCNKAVFDHLSGFNVKLWHVFDDKADAIASLPRGEWALTGGCSVGLRAMVVARFFGFRDMHVFGMDGCEGRTGKHAAVHPMQAPEFSYVDYEGVRYKTTPAFLHAAQGVLHELDVLNDVEAKFYGDGLVQAMVKNYKRKKFEPKDPRDMIGIAVEKPETISREYVELNKQLHEDNVFYGVSGQKYAETVAVIVTKLGGSASVLDYGCGKGMLAKSLEFPIWEYDPAIPGKDGVPRSADLVVCTDVLEHVEPDKLVFVLDDIRRCMKKVGYFIVHVGPAQKFFPNGQNVHLLQKSADWWLWMIGEFFIIGQHKVIEAEFDGMKTCEIRLLVEPKAAVVAQQEEKKGEEVAA